MIVPQQQQLICLCSIPVRERERVFLTIKYMLCTSHSHLVVAGGVACNQHIRGALLQLAAREGLELVLPPPKWCTDNGVMVAWAGHER